MQIVRIQVEEGFLHGLDVEPSPGLNVLIGARGTGKTSLIELIRFCLGVQANTNETARRSRDHALSVLGSGQVTITLSDGKNEVVVTRSASDEKPRSAMEFEAPAIFSQTEIETVGLQASGRLLLIDGFVNESSSNQTGERQAKAEFASISAEVDKYQRELDELEKQLSARTQIAQQLLESAEEHKSIALRSEDMGKKTQILDALNVQVTDRSVKASEGQRLLNEVAIWWQSFEGLLKKAPELDSQNSFPQAGALKQRVLAAKERLELDLTEVSAAYYQFKEVIDADVSSRVILETSARQVRQEIDALSEGSGLILRKVQQLQEQSAKLAALAEHYEKRKKSLEEVLLKRNSALDRLDGFREARYLARQSIVEKLNLDLGPRIRIILTRNAQTDSFEAAIVEALKGSGLRFSDIASAIAKNLSPRALVHAIDRFDQDLISEVAGIASDRAARTLTHLRSADIGALGTTDVDDDACFQLLDGKDFKDFTELSTGQRCTVVLPMVLAHREKVIIVDQPEDHIDNAFIADTLIRVLLDRDDSSQILFSTHNPNIPVLGNAEYVLQLGSDGKRGFALAQGGLTDKKVVEAVSNVMEGGALAFEKRAKFYSQQFPS